MKTMERRSAARTGLILLALFGAAIPAAHATSCTVSSPALVFGAYDAVAGTAVTSSATLSISCSGGGRKSAPVTIALDAGANSGGSFNPRVMKDGLSDPLDYNLYIDTSYAAASIWGDGTGGTQTVAVTTTPSGNPATASATINGQISSSQDPSGACPATPCNYSDSVVITITF